MIDGRSRLGQAILRHRKRMGLTQEDLASRMGVSRQSVAKWETGQSSPDLDRLILLREVLQTSLDDLIPPVQQAPPASTAQETTQTMPLPILPEPVTFRPFLLLGAFLLLLAGAGGLLILWTLSRIHPVRLVDWDGSLHTGLSGYLTAGDLWPVCLLACALTVCGLLLLLGSWLYGRQRSCTTPQA